MLYDVPAPAKINLFLHVVGRRADGYHLLQTVFQFVDLCDALHFDVRPDGRITRSIDVPGVSIDDDLTLRAARALQAATGVQKGVDVTLIKRIPTGGGLGGGSSDAASTLIALNRLWQCNLSRADLMQIGLGLGADVPVFVFGQNAFAQGIGEALTAISLPERAFVVAQPHVSVPTPEIFRAPDLTRDSFLITIADFLTQPSASFGRNDLESVVRRLYPSVGVGLDQLVRCALAVSRADPSESDAPVVRMSGSGSCAFVQCRDLHQAKLIEQEVLATMQQDFRLVQACPGLIEHPLLHWVAN